MRFTVALMTSAAALGLPSPVEAAPLSAAALECAVVETHAEVAADAIGVVVDNEPSGKSDAAMQKLEAVIASCARVHGVPEAQRSDYRGYSVIRVMLPVYVTQLTEAGFPLGKVDALFEIGPGRANTMEQIPSELVEPLVAMLEEAGMDIDAVPTRMWTMLGAYIGATAKVGSMEAKLKAG